MASRRQSEFPPIHQAHRLAACADFISSIGTLFQMAPWDRTELPRRLGELTLASPPASGRPASSSGQGERQPAIGSRADKRTSFRLMTSWSLSLSNKKSATVFFSRAFSLARFLSAASSRTILGQRTSSSLSTSRLTNPRCAADLRHRRLVFRLLDDRCLLRVRELDAFMRFRFSVYQGYDATNSN